jgi:hypothetical protein
MVFMPRHLRAEKRMFFVEGNSAADREFRARRRRVFA